MQENNYQKGAHELFDSTKPLNIKESKQWELYTKQFSDLGNITPIELFEQHIQNIYISTHQAIYESYTVWYGKLFNDYKTYQPKRIIKSNPKKIAAYMQTLYAIHKKYSAQQKRAKRYIDKHTSADSSWRRKRSLDDLVYYVIEDSDFVSDFVNGQKMLLHYDKRKTKLQELVRPLETSTRIEVTLFPLWKYKVERFLTKKLAADSNKWLRDESLANNILLIVNDIEKKETTNTPKAITLQETSSNRFNEPVILEEDSASTLLTKETHTIYSELLTTISTTEKASHFLTAEEQHIVETVKNTIISEGLQTLHNAQLINSPSYALIESNYSKTLLMSTTKIKDILKRIDSQITKTSSQNLELVQQLLA